MSRAYILMRDAFAMTARPLTRKELAKIIGRAAYILQPQDIIALDALIREGAIEGRLVKMNGTRRWEYKRK